jgi:SAM-dependent methyltransferase
MAPNKNYAKENMNKAENWGNYSQTYTAGDSSATNVQNIQSVPLYFSELAANWLVSAIEKAETTPVRFLDVAAGAGALTSAICNSLSAKHLKLPQGKDGNIFYVTDYAEGMINTAKGKLGSVNLEEIGLQVLEFLVMDACNPSPEVPPHSITHLGCMLGLMFFPDRMQALQKLHELLVPTQGKVIFGTFAEADFAHLANDFNEHITGNRLANPLEKLSCRDPVQLKEEFETTGYQRVTVRQEEKIFHLANDEGFLKAMSFNPANVEMFPIFKEMPFEELKSSWQSFLSPESVYAKKWLLEGDQHVLVMKWIANIVTATA